MGTVHQLAFTVVGSDAMPSWRQPFRRAFRLSAWARYAYELMARGVYVKESGTRNTGWVAK